MRRTIRAVVNEEISNSGMKSREDLADTYDPLKALFGPLNVPARAAAGGAAPPAPFGRQLKLAFRRAVVLKLRSKGQLTTMLTSTVVKAIILGVAFLNIDEEVPISQVAFIFLLAQMEVVGLLK